MKKINLLFLFLITGLFLKPAALDEIGYTDFSNPLLLTNGLRGGYTEIPCTLTCPDAATVVYTKGTFDYYTGRIRKETVCRDGHKTLAQIIQKDHSNLSEFYEAYCNAYRPFVDPAIIGSEGWRFK